MAGPSRRVLLIGLDGLPFDAVSPERMPRLWRLGADGGRAVNGGTTGLPATTYPSFGSLLTGMTPERHGVRTTARRDGAVPGWAGGTSVVGPTLVGACLAGGVNAWVVIGDQNLWDVLSFGNTPGWPGSPTLPPGTPRDPHGYAADMAVTEAALECLADWRSGFAFIHYNAANSVGHDTGPDSAESTASHQRLDQELGRLFDALIADWQHTLVMVMSDHDMQARSPLPAIDMQSMVELADQIEDVIGDGGAGWLLLRPGADAFSVAQAALRVDGVVLAEPSADGRRVLVGCADGRVLAGDEHPGGIHGGPGTARTHAIIGGGASEVKLLSTTFEVRTPRQMDVAPTIASLLGVALPTAQGANMLMLLPGAAGTRT